MTAGASSEHGRPAPGSALARLVEIESRLDRLIAERHAEAAALLAEARGRAATLRDAAERDIELARAALERELAEAHGVRLAKARAEADARMTRLAALDERGLEELTGWVVQRVTRAAAP